MSTLSHRLIAAAALAASFTALSTAHAAINQIALFRVAYFTQSSQVAPTTPDDYIFSARVFFDNPTDFDGGTLTYPGPGSPVSYSLVPAPSLPAQAYLNYGSSNEPTKASLDSDYPVGTYTTTATNSSTSDSQTSSVDYTVDAYPTTIPALTPSSYTTLQGANPSAPITVNFIPDVPDAAANETDLFFSIYDPSSNTVFNEGFLPASTTSITIPADTLAPNTAYTYNLIYSDRINSTNATDGVFDILGYDLNTTGAFSSGAAPEPASLAILALAAPALLRKRRHN